MMRLAYVHYLVEGNTGGHHVRQFVEGALSLGHEVDVCAMNLAPGGKRRSTEHESAWQAIRRILKKRFSRFLHEPKELMWNVPYIIKETALIRPIRPDVLLVRNALHTVSCVAVARRSSKAVAKLATVALE